MRIVFVLILLIAGLGSLQAQTETNALNRKDADNLKQGQWVITGEMRKDTAYAASDVIEEGEYENGRKVGLWIRYYPNGNVQSKINYVNGRPKGMYELYYDNGQVEEQGNWNRNKNTGDFKRFYDNGEMMQHFQFGEDGKRNGEQLYYYSNGEVEVRVDVIGGKENGSLKRYYPNGELKSEMSVAMGVADKNTYVEYKAKKEVKQPEKVDKVEKKVAKVEKAKPNIGTVDPEGYNKLYTRSLLLKWDGHYHHGKPWNGKKYIYDENGILTRIEVYKNGMYIGNGVIEEE
jgi:antitoxin component YwqK of YwqJK toxin-antitoxin module